MTSNREAHAILEHDFLETRGKILEIAAVLDRIDRAPAHHPEHPDPRLCQLRQALEALCVPEAGRAETIQLIFSREYETDWRTEFRLAPPRASSTKS